MTGVMQSAGAKTKKRSSRFVISFVAAVLLIMMIPFVSARKSHELESVLERAAKANGMKNRTESKDAFFATSKGTVRVQNVSNTRYISYTGDSLSIDEAQSVLDMIRNACSNCAIESHKSTDIDFSTTYDTFTIRPCRVHHRSIHIITFVPDRMCDSSDLDLSCSQIIVEVYDGKEFSLTDYIQNVLFRSTN